MCAVVLAAGAFFAFAVVDEVGNCDAEASADGQGGGEPFLGDGVAEDDEGESDDEEDDGVEFLVDAEVAGEQG